MEVVSVNKPSQKRNSKRLFVSASYEILLDNDTLQRAWTWERKRKDDFSLNLPGTASIDWHFY